MRQGCPGERRQAAAAVRADDLDAVDPAVAGAHQIDGASLQDELWLGELGLSPAEFDAAFLAVGAHIGKRAMIPSGDAAKIVDAISVLRSMEGEDKPMLGRRVVRRHRHQRVLGRGAHQLRAEHARLRRVER